MAEVKLADVIQPEVFTEYVTNRTVEKSALYQSGIIVNDPQFNILASGPSKLMDMPYWNDLADTEATSVAEATDLTAEGITTGKDVARKIMRAQMWGANNLAGALSGTDPMGKIAELVSDYWVRQDQRILLNILKGIFAAESMATNVFDISEKAAGANVLSPEAFLDSTQLLGDSKELLTAVMMNSYTETFLRKLNLIEYVPVADQGKPIPYFMDKRVIVDDMVPFSTTTGIGDMFLFGQGAIGQGNGSDPNIVPTEVDRDAQNSAGIDYLINRRIQLFHPRGIKWTETEVAGDFPTNAELATGTNWTKVYDTKKIRVVKFTFGTTANA
ncbi:major capsid protein [Bacillus marasmi]|uniref:major capsid protein n=1 Tax=Bacillus marasmi TaxID=1926279 RepID=UPI0011CCBB7A|nr:major capsid protein [Bacillus marasmi]